MKWDSHINTKGKHPQALTECHIFDIEDIYGNIPRSSPDMIFEGQSLTIKVIVGFPCIFTIILGGVVYTLIQK